MLVEVMKQIPSLLVMPGRKLIDFLAVIDDKLSSVERVLDTFHTFNVDVLNGLVTFSHGERFLEGFLDVTNLKIPCEELFNALSRIDGVKEVKHGEINENFSVLTCSPLVPYAGVSRLVMFRLEHIGKFMRTLKEKWGSGGEVFLYHLGMEAGKDSIKTFKKTLKISGRKLYEFILRLGKDFGWYTGFKLVEFDEEERKATIRFYDFFECKTVEEELGKSNSQWMRGAIAGAFKELFETEVKVEETKCIAKGDKYCEFTATSAS